MDRPFVRGAFNQTPLPASRFRKETSARTYRCLLELWKHEVAFFRSILVRLLLRFESFLNYSWINRSLTFIKLLSLCVHAQSC
jgi:hypothetical protein